MIPIVDRTAVRHVDIDDALAMREAQLDWGPHDDPHAADFRAGWMRRRDDLASCPPADDGASAAHLSGWIAADERNKNR